MSPDSDEAETLSLNSVDAKAVNWQDQLWWLPEKGKLAALGSNGVVIAWPWPGLTRLFCCDDALFVFVCDSGPQLLQLRTPLHRTRPEGDVRGFVTAMCKLNDEFVAVVENTELETDVRRILKFTVVPTFGPRVVSDVQLSIFVDARVHEIRPMRGPGFFQRHNFVVLRTNDALHFVSPTDGHGIARHLKYVYGAIVSFCEETDGTYWAIYENCLGTVSLVRMELGFDRVQYYRPRQLTTNSRFVSLTPELRTGLSALSGSTPASIYVQTTTHVLRLTNLRLERETLSACAPSPWDHRRAAEPKQCLFAV